jgi:hypothetical protein
MSDLEQMLKGQIQANLVGRLDSATQSGDIQAARQAAQALADFTSKNRPPDAPSFNNTDIRAAIKAKAPWFGVDPRRSAKVVEFGKNMEPASFKSAEEFADKIIEAIEEEYKETEADEEADEAEEDEEEKEEKKPVRKKTDAPSGSGARAIPRKTSGPWTKLSDAPKEVADNVKRATDKFTTNATKEARAKFIESALATAYAADQRTKGRK